MIPDTPSVPTSHKPHVLGIGGAHLDRRGQFDGAFIPGASIPGRMREDIGGGAFNALRTLVQRDCSAALFSVRGGDGGGEAVEAAIAAAGIEDLSAVFLDRATASYTALIDSGGEPVAALADMEIYEAGFVRQMRRTKLRDAIFRADAVLCDANLPQGALQSLCQTAGDQPLFGIAISPAKVVRFASILPSLSCLFLNRREADALSGAASSSLQDCLTRLAALGLRRAVVTSGAEAIGTFDGRNTFVLRPPPVEAVIDATGAGDALAGATAAALLHGRSLPAALREGAAAARLAVCASTCVPTLPADAFAAALAVIPQAEPLD